MAACLTYENLPSRIIVSNPFLNKPSTSYGVIAYCAKTNKWILVCPRYTPQFILYIRGSYRKSELTRLVSGFTIDEVEKLINVVENRQTFHSLFYSVIWGNTSDLEYAKLRFTESLKYIDLSKAQTSSKTNSKGWLWPKGRLASNFELPFHCALREFNEETGVMISTDHTLVSSIPLVESFRGNNGRTYETHCWVYLFPEEVNLPDVEDLESPGEIGERKWVREEEAKVLLRESKFSMLQDAKKLIEQKLVLGSFGK